MTHILKPPHEDEYAPFYAAYVGRVRHVTAPVDELAVQRRRFIDVLSAVSEDQAGFRYAPGKWSIKELIGHLSDAERIFAYRLLRIGRGDETPLPGWEENDYVRTAGSDARTFRDLMEEWAVVRDGTTTLAAAMPADAWERRGTANGTPISTRALLYIVLGHTEHHRAVLEERYAIT